MKLSRIQKISIAFFIFSLLPAYLIANWRHETNVAVISERFEEEKNLHLSTDKLISNCERNEQKENTPYGANHQICNQGAQEHLQTEHAMHRLEEEKSFNDARSYRNFILSTVLLNLLAFLIYKSQQFLTRKEN
jgi:hypothetical protein